MSDNPTNEATGLRAVGRRVLPGWAKRLAYRTERRTRPARESIKLRTMQARARRFRPGTIQRLGDARVRINDGDNFYILYKDIFVHEIYRFTAEREDPVVIDCGGNIGMSVLYYKQLYPNAKVTAYEPDPTIFPILQENIALNGLDDVEAIQAAIGGETGTLRFASDHLYGSCLGKHVPQDRAGWDQYDVPCVSLRDCLQEPVDFLKINIEGAEHDALRAAADRLHNVREMVVEYHHLPGLERNLHAILGMLHEQGFEYLVNDLDEQTNGGSAPPFRLTPQSRYYLLIYARQRSAIYRQAA